MSSSTADKSSQRQQPVLTDEAVLEYLKQKGLGTAALELSNHMMKKEEPKSMREKLEEEDAIFRNQRSLLTKVRILTIDSIIPVAMQ